MLDSGSVLPMSQNDPGQWGLRAGQRRRATELLRCARSGRHLPVCDGAAGSWTVTRSPPAGRGVSVRVPSCAWAILRTNRRTIRLITGTSGRAWPMRYSPDRLRRERISPPSTARESTPATTAAHSRRTPRSLPATVRGSPTRRSTSAKLSRRGHGRAGAVRARRGHHFSGVSTSTPPRSSKPRTWTSRISPVGISSWRTSGSPWANRCSSNDSSPCGTLSWMGSAITIPVPGDRATSAHCGMWCIRAAPGPQGCARTSARSRLFSGRLIGHWQGYRHKS